MSANGNANRNMECQRARTSVNAPSNKRADGREQLQPSEAVTLDAAYGQQTDRRRSVAHVRGLFSPAEQLKLLQELTDWGTQYNAKRDGPQHVCKNGSDFEIVFGLPGESCCPAGSGIAAAPQKVLHTGRGDLDLPLEYRTSFVDCFRYPTSRGRLRPHVDMLPGWVIVVSLGCDALFWAEEPISRTNSLFAVRDAERLPRREFRLASGDAMIFDGSCAANVLHGVEEVYPGTCPTHLPEAAQDYRFCLQYRQYFRERTA